MEREKMEKQGQDRGEGTEEPYRLPPSPPLDDRWEGGSRRDVGVSEILGVTVQIRRGTRSFLPRGPFRRVNWRTRQPPVL